MKTPCKNLYPSIVKTASIVQAKDGARLKMSESNDRYKAIATAARRSMKKAVSVLAIGVVHSLRHRRLSSAADGEGPPLWPLWPWGLIVLTGPNPSRTPVTPRFPQKGGATGGTITGTSIEVVRWKKLLYPEFLLGTNRQYFI